MNKSGIYNLKITICTNSLENPDKDAPWGNYQSNNPRLWVEYNERRWAQGNVVG